MHEDTASLHNSAKSNEGEVLPASVRYVEDESAEWAGLDYDIKVTRWGIYFYQKSVYPNYQNNLKILNMQVGLPPASCSQFLLEWNCGVFSGHPLPGQVRDIRISISQAAVAGQGGEGGSVCPVQEVERVQKTTVMSERF